jgi:hypothetical protein
MLDKAKAPAEVLQDQGRGEREASWTNQISKPREPFQSGYGLALEQFDWGHPNKLQTQWLHSKGVGLKAMLWPWPAGATRVASTTIISTQIRAA